MDAVVIVWVVWIIAVLSGAAAAVLTCPHWTMPQGWIAVRNRVTPVVRLSVRNLGRAPTSVVVLLLGAATVVVVGWPVGLLAHALQGGLDEPAFRWFEARRVGWWSDVWLKLTNIGSPAITQEVTVVAAVLFAMVWTLRGRAWWLPLVGLPLGYCLEKYTQIVLQTVVHRGHPPTTHGTYPSGGCARVMVVYGMVIFLIVAWRWPHSRRMWVAGWGLLACLVSIQGYARIYNLEHWLTDVVGGIVVGTMLLLVTTSCLRILGEPALQPQEDSARAVRRHVGVRPSRAASRSS